MRTKVELGRSDGISVSVTPRVAAILAIWQPENAEGWTFHAPTPKLGCGMLG